MKTVVQLCDYSPMYGGNFIPSLAALQRDLARRSCRCVFIFPLSAQSRGWTRLLSERGGTLYFTDFNAGKVEFIRAVHTILKNERADILHSHFTSILSVEIISWLSPGVKTFIHVHSDFSGGKKTLTEQVKEIVYYRLVVHNIRFLCVSDAFARRYPARCVYVPNALADERLVCEQVGGEAIRNTVGARDTDILCELLGWTPWRKGVDVAAEAIRRLNERGNERYLLCIVEGGEMTEEKLRAYIAENTACSGQEEYFVFLPPREDIFSLHEAADILVSASRSEGFPYAILEMLSIGGKVVMSDIPGTRWAKEYAATVNFASGDAERCAEAIETARAMPVDSEATAKAVRDAYSIDKWTAAVIEQYGI